jgi:MoaA/NifB/PqqE/SkfB family radical SAM enzyme
MLRPDVLEIIRKIRQGRSVPYVILVTNGSLLTPETIRQANEAGVDAYSISLDYPDERHDEFRMIPGLFRHLKNLIESLEPEERKRVTLNCVVQTDNYRDILPLARLASDWGVCMNYSPYTWMRTSERDYVVPKEKLPELRQIFRDLLDYEEKRGMVKSNATFLNNIVAFFDQEGIPGCRAGERFLVVNPDGTLSPCGLITTGYPNRVQLMEEFSKTNTCTACNTSIRSWTEKPFATFFSGIRPSTKSL